MKHIDLLLIALFPAVVLISCKSNPGQRSIDSAAQIKNAAEARERVEKVAQRDRDISCQEDLRRKQSDL